MSWHRQAGLAACALAAAWAAPALAADFGRRPTADEVRLWDIDVRPDGLGLPPGSGSVARGRQVYQESCSACHGDTGQGGFADRLAGGRGSLASDHPVKTIGSFWPYATTLFDYVRRAMPYTAPQTLGDDDTYAVVAFLLNLNGIVPDAATLDRASLPAVRMPNRDGFVPDAEFTRFRQARPPGGGTP